MNRFALPLCTFAAIGLAGCSSSYDAAPAGPVTTSSGAPVVAASGTPVVSPGSTAAPAYRTGYGIVESISLITLPAGAAAGGTIPTPVSGPYRVNVRMNDDSVQTVIMEQRLVFAGDPVQVRSDGRVIRP